VELLEKARILTYHRRRLGREPLKELGWRDRDSQERRFEALCRWGDLSGCTVLDLGCGHGDLKPYLDARFRDIKYLGIDFLPEFVAEAARRHGHLPDTHFLQADFLNTGLPEVDIAVACGSLNYKTENVLFPYSAIVRMWEVAARGVAFNLLDANVFEEDPVLGGHDPDEIHGFCRNLDPDAEIVDDYSPEDFTILMRK
jgi:SAM-dependent methyltransferase